MYFGWPLPRATVGVEQVKNAVAGGRFIIACKRLTYSSTYIIKQIPDS